LRTARGALVAWVPPAVAFALTILAWEWSVAAFEIPTYLLPRPSSVVTRLLEDPAFVLQHAAYTALESIVGLVLAIILGCLVAALIAFSPTASRIGYPYLVIIQVTPIVAIAPLLTIWLGFGVEPKIAVAFLVAFFPIAVNTAIGLRATDAVMIELMRSLATSARDQLIKLRVPVALPFFFSGLRVAAPGAVIGAIVGEFVSSDKGAGFLIIRSKGTLDTELLFLAIVLSAALGLLLFSLVVIAERYLLWWHPSHRTSR
jgi:NitT/TauT family transport system permease protein